MKDPAFISVKSLTDNSFINGNVEDSIIRVVIDRAQRAVVRPLIGTSLYKRLLVGIEFDFVPTSGPGPELNANELTLLNDYIAPLLQVACDERAVKPINWQTRNKSVSAGTDPTATPASISEVDVVTEAMKEDVVVAKRDLWGYLKDNCDLFPEFDEGECNFENIKPQRTQPIGQTIYMTG